MTAIHLDDIIRNVVEAISQSSEVTSSTDSFSREKYVKLMMSMNGTYNDLLMLREELLKEQQIVELPLQTVRKTRVDLRTVLASLVPPLDFSRIRRDSNSVVVEPGSGRRSNHLMTPEFPPSCRSMSRLSTGLPSDHSFV